MACLKPTSISHILHVIYRTTLLIITNYNNMLYKHHSNYVFLTNTDYNANSY